MPKFSAGLVVYRIATNSPEFLLVHPGGPYWARKDDGAWSIPKGEYGEGEDPLTVARREFEEETGSAIAGEFLALDPVKQPSGKIVTGWAVQADFDTSILRSNEITLEWPPRSAFPEVDRAEWFAPETALVKVTKGQQTILRQAIVLIAGRGSV